MVIRHVDFRPSEEQQALGEVARSWFQAKVPIDLVRKTQQLGFDAALWREALDMGFTRIALPESVGGDGAGVSELAVVVRQAGSVLAPIPLVEAACSARALAGAGKEPPADDSFLTFVPRRVRAIDRVLAPWGGAACGAVMLVGSSLVVVTFTDEDVAHEVIGGPPLVEIPLDEERWTTIVDGERAAELFESICRAWRILTAAALCGVAEAANQRTVEYACVREAFGGPIGRFQALAHPLVDVAMGIHTADRLVARAAWLHDHEPDVADGPAAMALLHAHRTAAAAVRHAIHVHGGVGFTVESEVQLFFRRAASMVLPGGDPERLLGEVGGLMAASEEWAHR